MSRPACSALPRVDLQFNSIVQARECGISAALCSWDGLDKLQPHDILINNYTECVFICMLNNILRIFNIF